MCMLMYYWHNLGSKKKINNAFYSEIYNIKYVWELY